jgi:peptidoglycan/LPS O-acetylase OafA/YrhL
VNCLLSNQTNNRSNNFNLIRFIASSLVILSHSYPLTGNQGEPLSQLGMSFGELAVDIFFITSGFLITSSLVSRKNLGLFIWSRILRIIPGLIVAILFCVFIVGVKYTTFPIHTYLSNPQTREFLFNNITLILKPLKWNLPGVFLENPYKASVNGSLWTLPWEIKMYFVLASIGFLHYSKRINISRNLFNTFILLIGIISTITYLTYHYNFPEKDFSDVHFLSMFFIGASFFVLRNRIILSHQISILSVFILVGLAKEPPIFYTAYYLLIGYLVIYLAYMPTFYVRTFNLFGDYSYGIYIYAFPVQQSIASSLPGVGVLEMFTIAFTLTLPIAMISWHFVEKPMLKMKSKYDFIESTINIMIKRFRNKKLF